MPRSVKLLLSAAGLAAIAACSPSYSPNTYSTGAVQQVNKVETGVVIGFRQVRISASGTVGAVIGSMIGTTLDHAAGDTFGWEYIVRKADGELLSVTQHEEAPLALGQKVLVIAGNQARIVADYSVPVELPAKAEKKAAPAKKPPLKPLAPVAESASPDPQPVVPIDEPPSTESATTPEPIPEKPAESAPEPATPPVVPDAPPTGADAAPEPVRSAEP